MSPGRADGCQSQDGGGSLDLADEWGALALTAGAAHKLPTEVCEAAPLSHLLVPEIGISGVFADRPL